MLRDTPRLILFESEKDKKKKRGRKKKQGGSKFSKEFLDAMRMVFGDSDESESEEEKDNSEEKKEDELSMMKTKGILNKRASESSLFVGDKDGNKGGDGAEEDEEDEDEDEEGENKNEDEMGDRSLSKHSAPKKPPRKKKKPGASFW